MMGWVARVGDWLDKGYEVSVLWGEVGDAPFDLVRSG